eukprot:943743-Pleurochrysis_carterae.AAC.3
MPLRLLLALQRNTTNPPLPPLGTPSPTLAGVTVPSTWCPPRTRRRSQPLGLVFAHDVANAIAHAVAAPPRALVRPHARTHAYARTHARTHTRTHAHTHASEAARTHTLVGGARAQLLARMHDCGACVRVRVPCANAHAAASAGGQAQA